VPEFSEASAFSLQADSFVLRDVICAYCSMCRDFDLLRDTSLLHGRSQTRAETSPPGLQQIEWTCPHCLSALDMDEIENRLLLQLDALSTRFLLQDLRCAQSQAVSQRLCAVASDTCVRLRMDYSADTARKELHTLEQVARLHGFGYLLREVEDMLEE
jgi:DNA polymerase epsilon subunit 1